MYNGVINIYKEKGFTSHDVVAKMRGILRQKKIGHTGTLDPDAEGVLPVCLGNATKLCDMLTDHEKEYVAVLKLGVETDTQDLTGNILKESEVDVSEEQIREIIASFVGDYDQIPPMYSALKVDGKRLYELARAGKEVERKPRRVTFYEIEIQDMALPEITIRVACSKGTYIRTLCHDIGQAAGCGGAMKSLVRTRSGIFSMDTAITLSKLEKVRDVNGLEEVIIPTEKMFDELPCVHVPDIYIKAVLNGNQFPSQHIMERRMFGDGEEVCVFGQDNRFYGIYTFVRAQGIFKPKKMFLGNGEA